MEKLEVGQYWHKPGLGVEWLLVKKYKSGHFKCKCTKSGGLWKLGELFTWASFYENGYVLGRHPDNIAPEPQPEQWQPKEGELVWVKFLEKSFKVDSIHENSKAWVFNNLYLGHLFPVPLSELEPYTNQDKPKIDFSKGEQWLTDGYSIVKNTGAFNDEVFYGHYLGQMYSGSIKFNIKKPWKLLNEKQEKLILELINKIKNE